jgi:hypothetical protein
VSASAEPDDKIAVSDPDRGLSRCIAGRGGERHGRQAARAMPSGCPEAIAELQVDGEGSVIADDHRHLDAFRRGTAPKVVSAVECEEAQQVQRLLMFR